MKHHLSPWNLNAVRRASFFILLIGECVKNDASTLYRVKHYVQFRMMNNLQPMASSYSVFMQFI